MTNKEAIIEYIKEFERHLRAIYDSVGFNLEMGALNDASESALTEVMRKIDKAGNE